MITSGIISNWFVIRESGQKETMDRPLVSVGVPSLLRVSQSICSEVLFLCRLTPICCEQRELCPCMCVYSLGKINQLLTTNCSFYHSVVCWLMEAITNCHTLCSSRLKWPYHQ